MTITRAGSETTLGISLLISSTENNRILSAFPLLCLPECVHLLLGDDGTLLSCALLRLQDLHLHLQLQERRGVSSSSTNNGDTRTAKGGGRNHDVLHISDLSQDTDVKHNSMCWISKPQLTLLPFATPFAFPSISSTGDEAQKAYCFKAKLLILFQILP